MSANFTPGPWRYTDECGTLVIRQKRYDDGFKDYIASTWGGKNEADARLIAAAPELLEALQQMLYWSESRLPCGDPSLQELVRAQAAARAAIVKATGAT